MPAATPMAIDPAGPTKPDAGVMATRPATAPEQMPITVGFLRIIHSTNIQVSAATAVAICVTVIVAGLMAALVLGKRKDPAPPHNRVPTHSSEAPMKVSTMVGGGAVSLRLPRTRAAIRPAT